MVNETTKFNLCEFGCRNLLCKLPHPISASTTVDEEFLCGICQELMVQPRCCVEGHSYCEVCIQKWLQTCQICPVDREPLNKATLTKNRPVDNMIARLNVSCSLKRQGCDWAGHRREYEEHPCKVREIQCEYCETNLREVNLSLHHEVCGLFIITCSRNCGWNGTRDAYSDHDSTCPLLPVICPDCEANMELQCLQEHKESSCSHRYICCEYCALRIQEKDMEEHLNQCEVMPVKCPYASVGCTVTVPRSQLANHSSDMAAHFPLMMNKLGEQSKHINEQSKQISEQSNQINEQSKQISDQSKHRGGGITMKDLQGLWVNSPQRQEVRVVIDQCSFASCGPVTIIHEPDMGTFCVPGWTLVQEDSFAGNILWRSKFSIETTRWTRVQTNS